MHGTLILMMLAPVIGAAALAWIFKDRTPWWFGPVTFLPGAALVGLVFLLSFGGQVADTEVWSGKITSKERLHDTYEESYECNCTTSRDSKGNTTRSCSTCYRTHYTVEWLAKSTIGNFRVRKLDETSSSVYRTPDPSRYTVIQPGDACSDTHTYTNYVQAVPNSLFASVKGSLMSQYANMLPKYPDDIYDLYKINRFVQVGFAFTDSAQWNEDIALALRDLGPQKQVNLIVVVAKTLDPDYAFALQQHWEGVNKNDVVLVIGSQDGQKIDWVRTLSWTKEEIFKIQLNDRIQELGIIDRTKIIPIVTDQIGKNFVRRRMREFEYLKGEIDPPGWLIALTLVLLAGGYAGAWYYLKREFAPRRYRY